MSVKITEDKQTVWQKIKEEIEFYTEYRFPFRQIRDTKYYLRNRFIRKHHLINTTLEKGKWWDTDTRLLYGTMQLLVEFIEKEKPFEYINWDSDDLHKNAAKEMNAIYAWWKDYPRKVEEQDKALSTWSDAKFKDKSKDILECINSPDTEEDKKNWKLINELEEKLLNEEEDMMIRLIKIRRFLWT